MAENNQVTEGGPIQVSGEERVYQKEGEDPQKNETLSSDNDTLPQDNNLSSLIGVSTPQQSRDLQSTSEDATTIAQVCVDAMEVEGASMDRLPEMQSDDRDCAEVVKPKMKQPKQESLHKAETTLKKYDGDGSHEVGRKIEEAQTHTMQNASPSPTQTRPQRNTERLNQYIDDFTGTSQYYIQEEGFPITGDPQNKPRLIPKSHCMPPPNRHWDDQQFRNDDEEDDETEKDYPSTPPSGGEDDGGEEGREEGS